MTLTAVYLAAGVSSRFGGRIKALVKLGPNDETLMGLSMQQAKKAGFDKFIIIASDKTLAPLKEFYKDNFLDIPVEYAIQETPEYREKPFGTSHALLAAKELIDEKFIVLNSDDIYGEISLQKISDYMKNTEKAYCLPGYNLKNVLAENGTVNRGIIKTDKDGFAIEIKEKFNISKEDIPSKFSENTQVSMNLFGLEKDFLEFLEQNFKVFLEENKNDPKKEWLLPGSITDFKDQTNSKVKVIPTPDKWIGITHPEDEPKAREKLKSV